MNKLRAIAALVLVPLLAGGAANGCQAQPTEAPKGGVQSWTFTAIAYSSDREVVPGFPAGIVVTAQDTEGKPVVLENRATGETDVGMDIDDAFLPYYYTFDVVPGLAWVEFAVAGILGPGQALACNLSPGAVGSLGGIAETDLSPFAAGPAGVPCRWPVGG